MMIGLQGRRMFTVLLFGAALFCSGMTVMLCLQHEPDNIEFRLYENGESFDAITTDSMEFRFVFAGDGANQVHWDFGDGTEAYDAAVVYKIYSDPGEYNVLCTASNEYGSRTSGYHLNIVEKEYSFFDGHERELVFFVLSVFFMTASVMSLKSDLRNRRRSGRSAYKR